MASRSASPEGTADEPAGEGRDRSAPGRRPPAGRPDETLLVAEVLRPHGLAGEVKIEVLSDVRGRFARGRELWLVPRGAAPEARRRVKIAGFRQRPRDALLRLEGIADRDRADALRGARLEVGLEAVPPAPPGCYYHHELIGCRCTDLGAGDLGTVVDVVEDGGGILLEVEQDAASRRILVPFVEPFLAAVDIAGRRLELTLPPGLVETCASAS